MEVLEGNKNKNVSVDKRVKPTIELVLYQDPDRFVYSILLVCE